MLCEPSVRGSRSKAQTLSQRWQRRCRVREIDETRLLAKYCNSTRRSALVSGVNESKLTISDSSRTCCLEKGEKFMLALTGLAHGFKEGGMGND
jgi:hypothetical protein